MDEGAPPSHIPRAAVLGPGVVPVFYPQTGVRGPMMSHFL